MFYVGDHRCKKHVFFGLKSKIHYLWWDTPHLQIKPTLYVWMRVQGSQIFKWNWSISIHSRVIAFLVICCAHDPHIVSTLSLLSPHCPHHPHIIPTVPTSSIWSPHHPHSTLTYPLYPPTIPLRGDPGISKNSIRFELIEIFQFCLKIWNLWRLSHLWVGIWWMDGWVNGWGHVKSLKLNKS